MNFNFSIEKDFRKILSLIFLFAILIGMAVIANGFYSISADDSDRTIIAYNFLHGKLPSDFDWLPLHTLILSGALAIIRDLFWVPRVISILFGLLSLAAIIILSHTLFPNKKITLLTSIYALIFPLRIIFSAVPLSEIMFASIITIGFVYFVRWLKLNSKKNLYLSALFFTLSSSVRYEGWIFAFSCFLLLLLFFTRKRVSIYSLIYSSLILASVPLLWLVFHAIINSNPFAFFQGPQGMYYKLVGDSLILRLKYNFLTHFVFQNLFYLIFFGLVAAAILSGKNKVIKKFLALWSFALLLMSVISLSGYGNPSHAFWRIPFIWNYLLIPFVAYLLYYFFGKEVLTRKIRLGIILIPIPVFYLVQTFILSGSSHFSVDDKTAGEYLFSLMVQDPDTKILLDTSEWNYLHVQVASQHPENFIFNSGHNPSEPANSIIGDNRNASIPALEKLGIDYLILQNPLIIRTIDNRGGFIKIRSFGTWELYKTDFKGIE